METEKINFLEQDVQLPCSRLVNGFRLCPFFTQLRHICWAVLPNNSLYIYAFDTLEHAECFAKSFSNNHSEKFWQKRHLSFHRPVRVAAPLDGYSIDDAINSRSYCKLIYDSAVSAVFAN